MLLLLLRLFWYLYESCAQINANQSADAVFRETRVALLACDVQDLNELLPQGRWAVTPDSATASIVPPELSTDPGIDQAWTSSPTTICIPNLPVNTSWNIKSLRVFGDTAYIVHEAPGGFVQTRVFVRKSSQWRQVHQHQSQSKL